MIELGLPDLADHVRGPGDDLDGGEQSTGPDTDSPASPVSPPSPARPLRAMRPLGQEHAEAVELVELVFNGVVFSACDGEQHTMDKLCSAIGEHVKGTEVKSEVPQDSHGVRYLGQHLVRIADLLFTQPSISHRFTDRRPLGELVNDLNAGLVDPLTEPSLRLDVVLWPKRGLISLDNRRLWCLREHQEHVWRTGGDHRSVRARVFELPESFEHLVQSSPIVDKFLRHYDPVGGGRFARVRQRGSERTVGEGSAISGQRAPRAKKKPRYRRHAAGEDGIWRKL